MIGIKLWKQLTLAKIHIFLSNAFSWEFIMIFRAILEKLSKVSRNFTYAYRFEGIRTVSNESHRLPITVLPFISACLSLYLFLVVAKSKT